MVRYFTTHKVTKDTFSNGYATEAEARTQAEFLATTYGGVATVGANDVDAPIHKFSAARGWRTVA